MTKPGLSAETRFWMKVDKTGGPDACWLWTGARTSAGYGNFMFNGRHELAHRLALRLTGTTLKRSECVLHTCDNPPCCNPGHLRIGTLSDNTQDMIAKGRWTPARGEHSGMRLHPERHCRGAAVPTAKLNEDTVRTIRARREAGWTCTRLAAEFGVSLQVISKVARREAWAHVA